MSAVPHILRKSEACSGLIAGLKGNGAPFGAIIIYMPAHLPSRAPSCLDCRHPQLPFAFLLASVCTLDRSLPNLQ